MAYLPVRIFDYNYVDRFDKPLEWRVSKQLRARSFEAVMSTSSFYVERVDSKEVHKRKREGRSFPYPYRIGKAKPSVSFAIQLPWTLIMSHFVHLPEGGYWLDYPTTVDNYQYHTHLKHVEGKERKAVISELKDRLSISLADILKEFLTTVDPIFVRLDVRGQKGRGRLEHTLTNMLLTDYRVVQKEASTGNSPHGKMWSYYVCKLDKLEPLLTRLFP